MDRNRKIVFSILILVVFSLILAIIDIGLNIQKTEQKTTFKITIPKTAPGIGIIRIYGPISISQSSNVMGIVSGADAKVKRLQELEKDDRIKAIVVRINSPGGTIAATQEIYKKLMELRKKNKILVASMGDMAASGGYYIASACNYIFANPGTITGSIGVIAVTPNLKGLFKKLGIKMNVIRSGQYKDLLSSYRDATPDEIELVQQLIDSSYNRFLKDVSWGRNMPIADIKPYADGRVFDGETALKYKLIDEIGSYNDAIEKAKGMAKLSADCPVYDDIRSPMEQILMTIESSFKKNNGIEQKLKPKKLSMIEYSIEP